MNLKQQEQPVGITAFVSENLPPELALKGKEAQSPKTG